MSQLSSHEMQITKQQKIDTMNFSTKTASHFS
jgi:hypothetical protein